MPFFRVDLLVGGRKSADSPDPHQPSTSPQQQLLFAIHLAIHRNHLELDIHRPEIRHRSRSMGSSKVSSSKEPLYKSHRPILCSAFRIPLPLATDATSAIVQEIEIIASHCPDTRRHLSTHPVHDSQSYPLVSWQLPHSCAPLLGER